MDRVDDPPESSDELPASGEAGETPDTCGVQPVDEGAGDGAEAGAPGEGDPELAALHAAQAEAAVLADKLKRVEAEFLNETKRIRRQAEQDRKYAVEQVVVDLLPVIDALTGARANLGEDEASRPMREGLALVEKQLGSVLERYGIAAIDALGQPFDPGRHQALMMIESSTHPPQTVCQVMRAGYELHGRVVRPAEVIVARAPAGPAREDAEGAPGGDA